MNVLFAERVERSHARPQFVAALEGGRPRDKLPGLVARPRLHASGQDDHPAMQRQRRHREAEMSRRVISAGLLSGDLLRCRLRVKSAGRGSWQLSPFHP